MNPACVTHGLVIDRVYEQQALWCVSSSSSYIYYILLLPLDGVLSPQSGMLLSIYCTCCLIVHSGCKAMMEHRDKEGSCYAMADG